MASISKLLIPKRGRSAKAKLYYYLRTSYGQFYISPTGSLAQFDTDNDALAKQLKQCMKQKDTLQAYICYSAGDCVAELNEIFVELIRENCRQYQFLRRLISFCGSINTATKLFLEIVVLCAGIAYCCCGLKLVKLLIM